MTDNSEPGKPRSGRLRGTVWLVALLVCAVVVVLAVTTLPSATTTAPSAATGRLVVASLPFWHFRAGTDTVLRQRAAINEVSPWMYGLDRDGRVVPQYPPEQAEAVHDRLDQLREADVPIMPSLANITDGAWAYEPVAKVLHDPGRMRQHVAEIVALVKRENYTGIDLDYEDLRGGDRAAFSTFVHQLASALHAEGKMLSVAVFAKTSDGGYDERNLAQDYAAIGRVADEVRIMAYDFHWSTSGPGPVAPIEWVIDVVRYAKSVIPPDRIVLGVPLFGYDWADNQGSPVTWQQAFERSRKYDAPPVFDPASQSPWFRYTDDRGRRHEVWFENAASTQAKLDAVRSAGIRGVYLWMYGEEDAAVWRNIRETMPVE